MPPVIQSSATMHVNMFWVTMPPPVAVHTNSDLRRRHSKYGGFHPGYATHSVQSGKLGRILSEERQKRYDHQPGRRRAVYEELETTQTTSIIRRIPAVHRYQIFPNASASIPSSSFNKITRNASWRFTSGAVRPSSNKEDVNLMIIPFGALFLFIVVCLLYISRWCIDDIREADRAVVTVIAEKQTDGSTRYVTNQSSHPRRNENCDESSAFAFGQSVANYNRSMAASQLNVGGRRTRTMRIAPARSTRSLNGLRVNSSGERLTRSAIRRINNAGSSSSSIPLTDLSSTSTLLLGSRRTIEHDEIVESCRRAVGNLLQNHIVVVPVDMTGYAGQFPGAGNGRTSHHSTRIRTRNNSSPAAATFSTAPAHRTSGIASEHSPVGGSSEASQTGSYCSDSRPLLGRYSSSSDGRIQLAEERMTSSDSNIDAKTGSPVSSRRRLQAMDKKRRGIACATPNVINKKTLGVMHQSSAGRSQQRRCHTYQQQYSVPAVSKLVYDSLNLSFRFFQVPAAVESSYSSSGKESLDSVFMGGGVTATDEGHSGSIGSSSRRATHPNVERVSPCSGALRLPAYEDDQATEAQQCTTDFRSDPQNNNNATGLSCDQTSCDSARLHVVTVHQAAETAAAGEAGTRTVTVAGGVRNFPPSIGRRSSSTAESAIYSASASADTLPGADVLVHSRLSESDRIKASSSSSGSLPGRAATRRSMSSSELHLQRLLQDEHAHGVTGE